MTKRLDYYCTFTDPTNGNVFGPTRMLLVHSMEEAKKELKRRKRNYPGWKAELLWSPEG